MPHVSLSKEEADYIYHLQKFIEGTISWEAHEGGSIKTTISIMAEDGT